MLRFILLMTDVPPSWLVWALGWVLEGLCLKLLLPTPPDLTLPWPLRWDLKDALAACSSHDV